MPFREELWNSEVVCDWRGTSQGARAKVRQSSQLRPVCGHGMQQSEERGRGDKCGPVCCVDGDD